MMLLSSDEIKKLVDEFLVKYSADLECKFYEFEDKIRNQGDRSPKMYIVKEGVIKLGKIENLTNPIVSTLGFCFGSGALVPLAFLFPNSKVPISLLEIKSIKNNLLKDKSQFNSVYEITAEQWNYIAGKDEMFRELPLHIFSHNLDASLVFSATVRKNRNANILYSTMYKTKHPILNSGIENKYIADFLGVTINTLNIFENKARLKQSEAK